MEELAIEAAGKTDKSIEIVILALLIYTIIKMACFIHVFIERRKLIKKGTEELDCPRSRRPWRRSAKPAMGVQLPPGALEIDVEESIEVLRNGLEGVGYQCKLHHPHKDIPSYNMTVYKKGVCIGQVYLINRGKLIVKVNSTFLKMMGSAAKEVSLFEPDSVDKIIGLLDATV